jgi:DNA repair exonuclease SbcCD ATPase subunit
MQLSQLKDEVEQLRQLLRHQAQENDALKACVSRLEAAEGCLARQLENMQEELVVARQAAARSANQARELQEYETVVHRLLVVFGLPIPAKRADGLEAASGGTDGSDATATEFETVERLRAELLAKTTELKSTSAKYEQFMVASYTVENSLVSKQTRLTRLVAELQAENTRLKAERGLEH